MQAKRCGHRPGKEVVATEEMCDRIKAAVDARTYEDFVIMARTDALANEGLEETLKRVQEYVQAGADMIFAEAVTDLSTYREFSRATGVPVLANMTEFGKTELYTTEQLGEAGAELVLYPLSAFRAMSAAAAQVYSTIRKENSQASVVPLMQTRDELYDVLNYHEYEQKLDQLFAQEKKK